MKTIDFCRLLEHEVRPLIGLTDEWRIFWRIRWDDESGGSSGTYVCHPEYRHAHINVWPARMRDRLELVEVIVHELCHLSHWPFTAYAHMVSEAVAGNPQDAVLGEAWTRAQEEYLSAVMMSRADVREVIERHAGSPLQYPLRPE